MSASECKIHRKLNEFSIFQFENKLQSIKASLRSGYKPLKQAAFRDLEKEQINVILENRKNLVELSWKCKEHIVNEINGTQFRRIHIKNIIFQCNEKDSCFKTCNNTVAILQNIVEAQGEIYFIGFSFSIAVDVYKYPLPSYLRIIKVSNQNIEKQCFPLTQIICKCWLIIKTNFIVLLENHPNSTLLNKYIF